MSIAKELILACRDLLAAESLQLVTADEMEEYCPVCARQIRAGEYEITHGELRKLIAEFEDQTSSRVAAKWEGPLPKGWTDESRKKFWDTLTGDVKHKVTKCIKEMEGKISDPGAFCASLADRVDPGWRSRDKKSSMAERVADHMIARAGETWENDHIRVHQFMNSLSVWDLTNAGKRGKMVDKFTVMTTPTSPKGMLDSEFNGFKVYNWDYKHTRNWISEVADDYPGELEIIDRQERGVDVMPAGFKPIKIDGKYVEIEAGYKNFTVNDKVDQNNLPACIPAFTGGQKSIPVFYRFVKDNQSKLRNMTFSEVRSAMQDAGIKYHSYCRMD